MPTEFKKSPLWLVQRSLYLDFRTVMLGHWTLKQKLDFIFKKYLLLFRHKGRPFVLGEDKVRLFGKDVYYGTKFGLSDYQSMVTRLQSLMDLSGMKKPKVVVDIGANVGFFSSLILTKYPKAKIYAFEPVPQVFECLRKNIETKGSGKIKLYNNALSSSNKVSKMHFDPGNSLISSVGKGGNIEVEAISLDSFVKKEKIKKIDLLKIDVEGFEHEVLKGAQGTLKNVHYLMIEITLEDNPNYTISNIFSKLYSKDFDFQLVGFRNYADVAEGEITLMDTILVNKKFK